MREIEFRAKDLDLNWIYGNLIQNEDICLIAPKVFTLDYCDECDRPFELVYSVINKTIGQYTGLKDKNGKKIFEGDIVKLENGFYEGLYNYVEIEEDEYYAVYYDEKYARYDLQTEDNNTEFKRVAWHQLVNEEIEVIGNIYDNPELVGEEV